MSGRAAHAVRMAVMAAAALWLGLPGLASALDPDLPPDRYSVTRWSADEGLPHSQIHDITQTADGFLWIATWEGTARFDGRAFHEVERLRHPDGRQLASRLLWRDADGSVLAGVDHLGLMRIRAQGLPQPACSRYPGLEAMVIAPGRDGAPWLVATDGLYRLGAEGECRPVDPARALTGQLVLALVEQEDGSLWAGNRRGLFRWHQGRLEPLGQQLGLPPGEVRAVLRVRDGSTWIAGDQGVWRYRDGQLERLRAERSEGLLQDRQGAVWVAATDSQVLRFWQGRWQQLDERHGLEGYTTGVMFEDREGLVWFGTTHGLFRISDGPAWGIGRHQGLSTDFIRSLLQSADGQVWVGHSGGLSRLRDDGRLAPVFPKAGDTGASVLSIARAGSGGVWAGTYNRGVLHFDADGPATMRSLVGPDSPLASEQVRALLEAPDGTLWIGTESGLMAWRDGALDPRPLPTLPALPVRSLALVPDGGLWIGLLGGLALHEPDGRTRVFAAEAEFPALSAFDFMADPDGTLWIASDRGLVRWRDGAFRLFGRDEGFPGGSVFRVLADAFDSLWISGNRGVARIPRASFEALDTGRSARLGMQVFGRDDGMPSRQANGGSMPAGWRMDSGELWLPTANGIAVFNPDRVTLAHRYDVPLVLDEVRVDGVLQPLAQRYDVPAGARLAIRFAGTSLRSPSALRYRYRMHGLDREWVEVGQAGEVVYTNLPGGALRFEVQVARAPAHWSEPANVLEVGVQVAAPWWSRPWALLLGGALLLLLFVAMHEWLGRRQRVRARRLEALVAQRTGQIRDQNRQLEEASRQRELLVRQLAHQASHDPLTGLPNRRAGDESLAVALQQADFAAAPLCVAIIDIDRFKHINDRYGHQAGDRVLVQVAVQLQASLRATRAFVGRIGGEEFLVLLPDLRLPDAVDALERVRRDVAALRLVPGDGQALACTISVGAVQRRPREGADALLQRADEALYAAKRQGRDRIVAG